MAALSGRQVLRSDAESLDPIDLAALENQILCRLTDFRSPYPEILSDLNLPVDLHVQSTWKEFLPSVVLEHVGMVGDTALKVAAPSDDVSSDQHVEPATVGIQFERAETDQFIMGTTCNSNAV